MSPLWPEPDPFADSFGINVRHPKAEGYNILVNSQWFRTVVGPENLLQYGTKDSLAERIDTAGSTYDNVLDIGYAWGRTDLSGGEGLDWDPRELAMDQQQAALDTIRYWDSNGIQTRRPNVAGEQYTIRLAQTVRDSALPGIDLVDMAKSDDFIYVAAGTDVAWYSSWSNPVEVGSDTLPALILAIAASPNGTVIVALDDGDAWAKRPSDPSFTRAYNDTIRDLKAQGVWYANGRFILGTWDNEDEAELVVLEWDGTDWNQDTVIDTASAPFWSVVESGPAIVAACGDGTVRTYTPEQDGTMELTPRGRTTMPDGESAILLGSNSSVLLIMTTSDLSADDRSTVRMYQAEVLDQRYDYTVGQLQLRREWNAVEHEALTTRNMANSRDEIFWFVKELVDGEYQEALWRFDVVTGGLNRIMSLTNTNLNGIIIFDSVMGAIDYTNDKIVISDETHHQTFGWMIFPNITFGLNTDITWISSIVEAFNLEGSGTQIEVFRSMDPKAILDWQHPSWVLMQRLSSQGSSGLEVEQKGVKSRTLALQLRMHASRGDVVSPEVSRVAIRGIPAHRDFIMMVPFNVSDYVTAPGRQPIRNAGQGDSLHKMVLDLVGQSVEVIVLDPPIGFRGVVNNVSEPIQFVADRGSTSVYVMVEFRGQRVVSTASPMGDSGMGLGLLGISTVGIGQTPVIQEA